MNWQRIKDFVHDPQVKYYAVIAVGRPVDLARYRDGQWTDLYHDDHILEPLYYMPLPDSPQEMNQWFYGEPNGYRLRTCPPWVDPSEWDAEVQKENEAQRHLEQEIPVGTTVEFRPISRKGTLTGVVSQVSSFNYLVSVNGNESWWVEPKQIVAHA